MGKIIQFPKRIIKKITCTSLDFIDVRDEIESIEFDIELAEGYNETWKDYKSEEEYNYCLKDIDNMRAKAKELKKKLDEMALELNIDNY